MFSEIWSRSCNIWKIAYTACQSTFAQLNSFTQASCPQSSPAGCRIKCRAQVLLRKRGKNCSCVICPPSIHLLHITCAPPGVIFFLHSGLFMFLCLFLKCFCLWFHLLTNEASHPHLYLLTVTSQTRAASPPSTTKTCTTTRVSGTCESFMAYIAVTQNTHSFLYTFVSF